MKILGTTGENWKKVFIVEISEDELKSAFEKGYDSTDFSKLKAGDVVSLADIPNQRMRIQSAIKAMHAAYEEFVKAAPVMAEIALVIQAESCGEQQ